MEFVEITIVFLDPFGVRDELPDSLELEWGLTLFKPRSVAVSPHRCSLPTNETRRTQRRARPNGRWPMARCITSYCTPMMWPMASIQYAALWAPGICM